ncbi:hypothetical protein RHSIM_Rhsim07G0224600 [Rhododendron simsii]|uniref:Sialate O-acetylesterase domain-containing protein n=1 Tax=Rhododendron simsii TaxID=118357 RepID=A0A834GR72_RHOSS|nr:hypothetical protein RHSIM_Rhsim07G0224600 [Rhododendron simsii]
MFTFLSLILLAHAISPASSQEKNIFLLAGQSNMSGRGGVTNGTWDGFVPPGCGPNPSVLRLAANLTWVPAAEPLHKDIDVNVTAGVGPGMSFANALLAYDPGLGVVGLVPCAIGGTKISQWVRGSFLYDQLVRRAGAAARGGGKIQAMLWYQGESDTVDEEDAESYKGRLEKFFEDLRSDLQSPSLPIIQVAIASAQGPFIEKVREAQLRLDLANVKCVDAKGLELGRDHLHLTTSAEAQLGGMLAGSFLRTRPRPIKNNAPSSPPPSSTLPSSANPRILPPTTVVAQLIRPTVNESGEQRLEPGVLRGFGALLDRIWAATAAPRVLCDAAHEHVAEACRREHVAEAFVGNHLSEFLELNVF